MSGAHPRRALVLGSGVSGLSCALKLARSGFAVESWEREPVERAVSSVAAAIWYPYKAGPAALVERWAFETLDELTQCARDPESGVTLTRGRELFPRGIEPPAWIGRLPRCRELNSTEFSGEYARGFEFQVPVIEMPSYLAWLRMRCTELGVRFATRAVESLSEALDHTPIVVNCTGLASRELCRDRALVPIRGQVVVVERRAEDRFLIDDYGPRGLTYIVPRARDCVLGGSADEGREDTAPDEAETRSIVARCVAHVPDIAQRRISAVKVGLRPYRPEVRLESEILRSGTLVVHDYGHGGAGVTLSLGCAAAVTRLVVRAQAARTLPR